MTACFIGVSKDLEIGWKEDKFGETCRKEISERLLNIHFRFVVKALFVV